MGARSAKDLTVYTKAYALAMRVFAIGKRFPNEKHFALTGQIRYPAHFVSKLTDCDGETSETDSSLDFARDCGYLTPDEHQDLAAQCAEVGRMLGSMICNPDPFLLIPDS